MQSIYWLIVLAVLLVLEIITLGLATIWFAGGALVAFILSLFLDSLMIELIAFFVVSFLLLFFTRPFAVKYFNKERVKTNYESIIGKQAKVTEIIDNFNNSGTVILNGQEWTARAEHDQIINVGERVYVKQISGVKLIVGFEKEEII